MDRPESKLHSPAGDGGGSSSTAPGSSKRPRWTTSTFGPMAGSLSVDKGKGREQADGGGDRLLSRVAPPSFAFPEPEAKRKSASRPSPKTVTATRPAVAQLPRLPLEPPGVAESAESRPSKRPRTSTGSILGRLPIPLAAPSPDESPPDKTTTPVQKRTRPLSLATSFSGGGLLDSGSSGAKPASLRRTMALSSVVPTSLQTPTKVKAIKVERELMHGILDIPQGKERLKEEVEASRSAVGGVTAMGMSTERIGGDNRSPGTVKVEDALMGVSPRKGRKASGPKGNLQTAATLLITSHHSTLTRFYQSLLARRDALPSADIVLRIVALPSGTSAAVATSPAPARRLFPFQKAGPPVKRIPLICHVVSQTVKEEPTAAAVLVLASSGSSPSPSPRRNSYGSGDDELPKASRTHVLLRIDEHSTSIPPTVSRWAKPHVGQRILGWRPWAELGTINAGGIEPERVLGLERFVVLDQ